MQEVLSHYGRMCHGFQFKSLLSKRGGVCQFFKVARRTKCVFVHLLLCFFLASSGSLFTLSNLVSRYQQLVLLCHLNEILDRHSECRSYDPCLGLSRTFVKDIIPPFLHLFFASFFCIFFSDFWTYITISDRQ